MKVHQLFMIVVLTAGVATANGTAQQNKIPQEVWQQAKNNSVASVTVNLNVPWQPEGQLSKDKVEAQRQSIISAQEELLRQLAGTRNKVRFKMRTVPYLSMEVGEDALAVLDHSALVTQDYRVLFGRL